MTRKNRWKRVFYYFLFFIRVDLVCDLSSRLRIRIEFPFTHFLPDFSLTTVTRPWAANFVLSVFLFFFFCYRAIISEKTKNKKTQFNTRTLKIKIKNKINVFFSTVRRSREKKKEIISVLFLIDAKDRRQIYPQTAIFNIFRKKK